MNNARLALGVLLATAGGGSVAQAQVTSSNMASGRIERHLEFHARAQVDYDNNLARTSDERAALQGVEPEDTIFTPSLEASITQPIGRQAVFLQGVVSYNFHDKNTQLDHDRWNLTAGLANKLGPCGSVLSGSYLRGRSELDDYTLVSRVENVLTVKRVAVDITCVRPPGLGIILSGSKDWGDNSLALVEENDYETTSASGGITYSRPSMGTISLLGGYTRTEYPNRLTLSGQEDGYELTNVGVRLERRLGGRIQADAAFGYSWVNLLAPTLPLPGVPDANSQFEGWIYSVDASYKASGRLTALAGFEKRISPTLIEGRTYEIQTNVDLRANYRIGSRFLASLGALQRKSDSQAGIPINPFTLTDSRTRAVLGSLRYQQSERLSFVLTAQHEKRKADNPAFNYNGERVGLSADFAF